MSLSLSPNASPAASAQPRTRGAGWSTPKPPKPKIDRNFWHRMFNPQVMANPEAYYTRVEYGYLMGFMDSKKIHAKVLKKCINWYQKNGPGTYNYAMYLHRNFGLPQPAPYNVPQQSNRNRNRNRNPSRNRNRSWSKNNNRTRNQQRQKTQQKRQSIGIQTQLPQAPQTQLPQPPQTQLPQPPQTQLTQTMQQS